MGFIRAISAENAKNYYYEKDCISAPEGKGENSEWFGKIAEMLGFEGRVDAKAFHSVVKGDFLETKRDDHRAGYDFVCSPSKSVSIMALHYGDTRLLNAHKAAVKETLEYMENTIMQARLTDNGVTVKVPTDSMLASTYFHTTSRDNDPLMHTHVIIANITATDRGFRALSNELLYENQMLISRVYQNAIAAKVQELGYQITNEGNKFEIDGVSKRAIEIFSKRSESMDEVVTELTAKYPHLSEPEIRDLANFETRADKTFVSEDILKSQWENEFPREKLYKKPDKKLNVKISYQEMFNKAVDETSKSQMAFDTNTLLSTMLAHNRGNVELEKAEQIIKDNINKRILAISDVFFSTPEQIDMESRIITEVRQGKNAVKPLMTAEQAAEAVNQYEGLTKSQNKALSAMLTTTNRINLIQGDAGTGKTFVIDKLRESLARQNIDTALMGVAFTGNAARELHDAANIKTSTIASYLGNSSDKERILIVDESSMLSSRDMLALLDKSKNSRIVFVGDTKQLQAIGAGKMFKELQRETVVQIVHMNDVLRQKTDVTRAVVSNIANYQEGRDPEGLRRSIGVLKDNQCIRECVDIVSIAFTALEEYKTDPDTVVLTNTRTERDTINATIRAKFHSGKPAHLFNIKEQLSSSVFATDYKAGDVVYHANKYYKVKNVDEQNNIMSISGSGGTVAINPRLADLPIYRDREREFVQGEKVTFLKNDYKLNVQNGLTGVITALDKHGNVRVRTSGNSYSFNLKDYPYIDYAYAQTICKSQGGTYNKTVLVGSSFTTEAFYTAASRSKSEFKIITSDLERLEHSIHRQQFKTSTRSVEQKSDFAYKSAGVMRSKIENKDYAK